MLVVLIIALLLVVTMLVYASCDTAQMRAIVCDVHTPGNWFTLRDKGGLVDRDIITTYLPKPWLPAGSDDQIPVFECGLNDDTEHVIIFCNTLERNMANGIIKTLPFLQSNFGVVTFDFSGYGANAFRSVERQMSGLTRTFKVVLNYVATTYAQCRITCVAEEFSSSILVKSLMSTSEGSLVDRFCLVNPMYRVRHMYTDVESNLPYNLTQLRQSGLIILSPSMKSLDMLAGGRQDLISAVETIDSCVLSMVSKTSWATFAGLIVNFVKSHESEEVDPGASENGTDSQ